MYPVDAMAFATNGRLLAEHLAYNTNTAQQFEQFTAYHLDLSGDPPRKSVALAGSPAGDNSMSVFPQTALPALRPSARLRHARVGHHLHASMSVANAVGSYHYRVVKGSLPKGLHLIGHTVTGTPKSTGTHHVEIRATNQYGGVVMHAYTIKVRG
jgi:hypothetical protein